MSEENGGRRLSGPPVPVYRGVPGEPGLPASPGAAGLGEAMRYSLLAGERIRPVLRFLAAARGRRGRSRAALRRPPPSSSSTRTRSSTTTCRPSTTTTYGGGGRRHAPSATTSPSWPATRSSRRPSQPRRRHARRGSGRSIEVLGELTEIPCGDRRSAAWSGSSSWTSPARQAAGRATCEQMHALKTGRLIQAAVVCGALLGLAAPARQSPYPRLRRRARPALPDRRRHPRRAPRRAGRSG